jgi:CspA family cold shock protein
MMAMAESMEMGKSAGGKTPSTETVCARLKWFNAPKGFGFVVPEDRNIEAFLHITTLQRAGVNSLGEGARLLCHIGPGPKGVQVTEIVQMLDTGAPPAATARRPVAANNFQGAAREGGLVHLTGAVKWYKRDKGFGFVVPDDGMKDVFIHKNCLMPRGLDDLLPGTRLSMTVRIVPKGREVVEFEVVG